MFVGLALLVISCNMPLASPDCSDSLFVDTKEQYTYPIAMYMLVPQLGTILLALQGTPSNKDLYELRRFRSEYRSRIRSLDMKSFQAVRKIINHGAKALVNSKVCSLFIERRTYYRRRFRIPSLKLRLGGSPRLTVHASHLNPKSGSLQIKLVSLLLKRGCLQLKLVSLHRKLGSLQLYPGSLHFMPGFLQSIVVLYNSILALYKSSLPLYSSSLGSNS